MSLTDTIQRGMLTCVDDVPLIICINSFFLRFEGVFIVKVYWYIIDIEGL